MPNSKKYLGIKRQWKEFAVPYKETSKQKLPGQKKKKKKKRTHWSLIRVDPAHDAPKQLFRDRVAIVQHLKDT